MSYKKEQVSAATFAAISLMLKCNLPAAYRGSVDTYAADSDLLLNARKRIVVYIGGDPVSCYAVSDQGELFSCINVDRGVNMSQLIHDDKDIYSAFSLNNPWLLHFYAKCGFTPYCSLTWDDDQAPENYNSIKYGKMPLIGWIKFNNDLDPYSTEGFIERDSFSKDLLVAIYNNKYTYYDLFHDDLIMTGQEIN